ncbi:MAG: glutamate-1-semialdehyde 2,1-aminomutase, partial [Burkholderiaceae bacterium]
LVGYKAYRRLGLSRVKHPSLTGHARMAKTFARFVPNYQYPVNHWLGIDGADPAVVDRRRRGFSRLAAALSQRSPKTIAAAAESAEFI